MKPRVLLADDHTLVLEGLRKLLEADFELVGAVEDGRSLVSAAERLRPDVILLDIAMPLLNGVEAARQIKKKMPDARLIFLTMHADATYASQAFRAGASGYLLKRSAASELITAIRRVLRGRRYVTPLLRRDLPAEFVAQLAGKKSTAELTGRQREVLQLLAEGCSFKQIANILNVSVKTVEFHKSSIAQKLGVRTTAELTRYAMEHGIVGP